MTTEPEPEHNTNGDGTDCWCNPRVEDIPAADGSHGRLVSHNTADGREHREHDHDRDACDECNGTPHFSLVLAFADQTAPFAYGFEAGRLWEQLKAEPGEAIEEIVHVANAGLFIRMGEALSRKVSSVEHNDTWMTVTFEAADD